MYIHFPPALVGLIFRVPTASFDRRKKGGSAPLCTAPLTQDPIDYLDGNPIHIISASRHSDRHLSYSSSEVLLHRPAVLPPRSSASRRRPRNGVSPWERCLLQRAFPVRASAGASRAPRRSRKSRQRVYIQNSIKPQVGSKYNV